MVLSGEEYVLFDLAQNLYLPLELVIIDIGTPLWKFSCKLRMVMRGIKDVDTASYLLPIC